MDAPCEVRRARVATAVKRMHPPSPARLYEAWRKVRHDGDANGVVCLVCLFAEEPWWTP